MATTASRPIRVIASGRSHRARPTTWAGFAAISAISSPISIAGTSQSGPSASRSGSTIRSTTEMAMNDASANAIGQRGSMKTGSSSGADGSAAAPPMDSSSATTA